VWPLFAGLDSCRAFTRRWLRFDVIEDLLDYVWVSDVSDDAYGATTQGAGGNPQAALSY
jgi:hypothetical protein